MKTETLSAVGETDLVSSYTYDTAGRPKTRTLPGNLTTTIQYTPYDIYHASDYRIQNTTTFPGGGTKTELLYRDGRTHSVTGTAVPDSVTTYVYDPVSGNLKTTQTTAGQTATTEADWLGRTLNAVAATWGDGITPGSRTTTNIYNTRGQLTSQKTTSGAEQLGLAHLYEYDPNGFGWLYREALDSNGNGI
ncbi:MAG: hypothetical protein IPP19_00005, partial [Verrucomicrobia bacterium]|nr:hypothetical protein [Verrucomicrobiota bacterium]